MKIEDYPQADVWKKQFCRQGAAYFLKPYFQSEFYVVWQKKNYEDAMLSGHQFKKINSLGGDYTRHCFGIHTGTNINPKRKIDGSGKVGNTNHLNHERPQLEYTGYTYEYNCHYHHHHHHHYYYYKRTGRCS